MSSINQEVGKRLRRRRTLLGLSLQKVANACSICCQQVQKYESGAASMSVGRLVQLSQALNVPPSYFTDGLGAADLARAPVSCLQSSTSKTEAALHQWSARPNARAG